VFDFLKGQRVQTVSYRMGSGGKVAGGVKLMPRLRMRGAMPPPFIFIMKQRDKTF
jgi:hypothetical protein